MLKQPLLVGIKARPSLLSLGAMGVVEEQGLGDKRAAALPLGTRVSLIHSGVPSLSWQWLHSDKGFAEVTKLPLF